MRRQLLSPLFWTLSALAIAVALLWGWFSGVRSGYRVGDTLADHGLDPRRPDRTIFTKTVFHWATTAYEPVKEYASKHGTNLGGFTGSILLSRPGTPMDGFTIGVMGGKFSHGDSSGMKDPEMAKDIQVLREKNLRAMLAQSIGDWRIVNDDGHFIEVDQPTFTGNVHISRSGWFQTMVRLEVVEDRIIRVSRSPILFD